MQPDKDPPSGGGELELTELFEHLSVPYVAVFYSVEREDGEWTHRGEYPELGCVVEADSESDLVERLEDERVRAIISILEQGGCPPRTGPGLGSGASGLSELPLADLYRRATGG